MGEHLAKGLPGKQQLGGARGPGVKTRGKWTGKLPLYSRKIPPLEFPRPQVIDGQEEAAVFNEPQKRRPEKN